MLTGLHKLIEAEDDLQVVGSASNGPAALKLIRDTKPDVAVLDISMPELNGILVAQRLTRELPGVKLMMLTLHEDRAYLKQALEAGVRGYVLKRSAAEALVPAIRAVMVGDSMSDPAVVGRVFEGKQSQTANIDMRSLPDLTGREAEVLNVGAGIYRQGNCPAGCSRRQNDRDLQIPRYGKARPRHRAELVRFAAVQGWLSDI